METITQNAVITNRIINGQIINNYIWYITWI